MEGIGHRNIKATHKTTFMFTRDREISKRADCVVGVGFNHALNDLPDYFKKTLRNRSSKLRITVKVGGLSEVIMAWGDERLTLKSDRDIVVRKSSYICDRTLAVRADKSASDFSREMVSLLRRCLPVKVMLEFVS